MSKQVRLLEVEDLHVTYKVAGQDPVRAVRGVSFAIERGGSLGIVGESGCGKSSLARTLVGLQRPSGGSMRFEGHDLTQMERRVGARWHRTAQMIFQDAAGSLNPRMTVRQTLSEVVRVHHLAAGGAVEARIGELLARVGLPESVMESYPREISGGQCQRVSLARALALEPQLIIADEPVSALDVSVQARILNLIRELQQELSLAVILISHDLAVVRNVCDRVAVMYNGVFVEHGVAADVFDNPQHEYTRQLLAAVPKIGR